MNGSLHATCSFWKRRKFFWRILYAFLTPNGCRNIAPPRIGFRTCIAAPEDYDQDDSAGT